MTDHDPYGHDDDLEDYTTPMRRFIEVVKPYLGIVLAIALVVPLGGGLLNWFLFDRAGDQVAGQLEDADVDAALIDAVFLVRATACNGSGTSSGTAFATVLDGQDVLVTNRHVVSGAQTVGVQALSGEPGPRVTSWRVAGVADVAVLFFDEAEFSTVLPIADEAPAEGTDVRTVGFPNAMPFTTTGAIADASDSRLDLDLEVDPGASGSPVLVDSGAVVGQVYARTQSGAGVATALPALVEALNDLGESLTGC